MVNALLSLFLLVSCTWAQDLRRHRRSQYVIQETESDMTHVKMEDERARLRQEVSWFCTSIS
jgi:hypothetical protein